MEKRQSKFNYLLNREGEMERDPEKGQKYRRCVSKSIKCLSRSGQLSEVHYQKSVICQKEILNKLQLT